MNYKIRSGDTLSQLANRFGTTVSALAKANGIKNVNLIYAGANLKVDGFDGGGKSGGSRGGSTRGGATRGGGSTSQTQGSGESSFVGGSIHATAAMKRLAEAGKRAAMGMGGYRGLGLCATGVSRAISSALGLSVHGNGNQIDNNLPKSKFKQVNISLAEALKIPGLILTWERTSTAAGSKYGHTAITTGDGRSSTSDFIERDTLHAGGRSGLKIFVPI
jgi:LysM repeat protein